MVSIKPAAGQASIKRLSGIALIDVGKVHKHEPASMGAGLTSHLIQHFQVVFGGETQMGSGRVPGSIGYDGGLLDVGTIPLPPNAGFEARGHLGQGDASVTGPRLTGWPRQVSWSEFQDVATRPSGETEDAQIDTQTLQPERVGVAREQGQFRLGNFTAKLNVIRDTSWIVVSQKSDKLLVHEQGHFDITGLVARDLVKALGALRVSTTDELQREVSRLFEDYDTWAKSLSKQYDDETNHGRNTKLQSEWESRIRTCIQQGTSLGAAPR